MPGKLNGAVSVPPSKSYTIRALICAALAEGESAISPYYSSRDVDACIRGVEVLGASCRRRGTGIAVNGHSCRHIYSLDNGRLFGCDESATALRFLIPVSLLSGGGFFRGERSLMNRPLTPYIELFAGMGIDFRNIGSLISVRGRLEAGLYELSGDISSQFVSGLLLALPLLSGDSEISLTTELSGKNYVEMTMRTMRQFGVEVEMTGARTFFIKGGQQYLPADMVIEGDHSQAAFFLAANFCGSNIKCLFLNPESLQSDRVAATILKLMREEDELRLDIDESPDLLPPLAVAAALRDGKKTVFLNLARTREKESDRLMAIARELKKLGAILAMGRDHLQIEGISTLTGGRVSGWGDHRIVMSLAIAATCCQQPLIIEGADCVNKSYPTFFDDFESLGGQISWI